MPTVVIPDKICPHCEGTEWFQSYKNNGDIKYVCKQRQRENKKKYKKTEKGKINNRKYHSKKYKTDSEKLNDAYIKNTIHALFRCRKDKISYKDISPEMITVYRNLIIVNRKNKKLRKEREIKMKPRLQTKEEIQAKIDSGVFTPEMTNAEKNRISAMRSYYKKRLNKLNSVQEYEEVAAITSSEENTELVNPFSGNLSILKEKIERFNEKSEKLEKLRDELSKEIEAYNEKIESLKIVL